MEQLYTFAGNACYAFLAADALWGSYCVLVVWRRLAQLRFRNEETQDAFLDVVETNLEAGNWDAVAADCEGDPRALARLVHVAISRRQAGYARVRQLLVDRFQRDVLADLEYRLSWVQTVIKSAPMLGLFGTVLGMMAAFAKLSSGDASVEKSKLAEDISLALITTAIGLSIAIPLTLCTASININLRKLEDLVGLGLTRFLEHFRKFVGE